MQKDSNLDQKIELLLTAGQLLTENGATNDKTIRVLNRIAAFMEIPEKNVRLQIMHQHIFLEIFDGEKSVFAFRKCPKTGVDFQIIYSITKMSCQIFKKSVTLDELKKFLEDIASCKVLIIQRNLHSSVCKLSALMICLQCFLLHLSSLSLQIYT